MKLRTQILLFFFAFAFTPLLIAVVINLPLVLERMELFYQKAHLQNLRADFRDLDQHLASRHEMVRLLAKLPEPGSLLGSANDENGDAIDLARTRYIQWINQILHEQLDIVQIVFLDARGDERFWLERDPGNQSWQPTVRRPGRPPEALIGAALQAEPGRVLVSALSLNPDAGALDPRRFMNLRLITPIHGQQGEAPIGAVMLNVDVGGIARFYRETLWVDSDGGFLEIPAPDAPTGDAFVRYPGLAALFTREKPALWKGRDEQIMWVPMFRTEQSRSLWVGRRVDPSPIAEFRDALTLRVLSIIFLLMLATWLASHWLARRAERLSRELIDGIQHILEEKEEAPVTFDWKGPRELRRLGRNLTRLAEQHGRTSRNLRAHARELEASNRYKSQFLANISHELKTPLNSILLLSKLLAGARQGLSGEQLQQARVIHEAGCDLQALIDNILDLSRIEARRTPLHAQSVTLPPLLQGVVELIQPQFDAKGLTLQLELEPAAPQQIVSDPDKLRQILKNFLSNAVKFTHQGEVRMRLAAPEPADTPHYVVEISVRDSGIGIPAEKQGEIFEAFKQADGATNRRYGGTGLGLTISRQLACLLGGDIRLRSRPGQGSRFSLLLPATLGSAPATAEPVAESAAGGPRPDLPDTSETMGSEPRLGRHAVLVVDAHLPNLLQLTPLLERTGLRVTAAETADEAIELLLEETFALALIDVIPPADNACDTIRRIKQTRRLPVIALMSDAPPQMAAACRAAGADALLQRPIERGELHRLLGKLLPAEALDSK